MNKALFETGQAVTHRKGGKYRILHNNALDCDTMEPAYVYQALIDNTVWVRKQSEMEDGRFTNDEEGVA